jgi:hypothetical protein
MMNIRVGLTDALATDEAMITSRGQVYMIQAGVAPEKIDQQVRQVSHVGPYSVKEKMLVYGTTKVSRHDRL